MNRRTNTSQFRLKQDTQNRESRKEKGERRRRRRKLKIWFLDLTLTSGSFSKLVDNSDPDFFGPQRDPN